MSATKEIILMEDGGFAYLDGSLEYHYDNKGYCIAFIDHKESKEFVEVNDESFYLTREEIDALMNDPNVLLI